MGLTIIRLTVPQPLFLHTVPGLTPFVFSPPGKKEAPSKVHCRSSNVPKEMQGRETLLWVITVIWYFTTQLSKFPCADWQAIKMTSDVTCMPSQQKIKPLPLILFFSYFFSMLVWKKKNNQKTN